MKLTHKERGEETAQYQKPMRGCYQKSLKSTRKRKCSSIVQGKMSKKAQISNSVREVQT